VVPWALTAKLLTAPPAVSASFDTTASPAASIGAR
jgi:hypothetical protein